jgi:hypothetical protein
MAREGAVLQAGRKGVKEDVAETRRGIIRRELGSASWKARAAAASAF